MRESRRAYAAAQGAPPPAQRPQHPRSQQGEEAPAEGAPEGDKDGKNGVMFVAVLVLFLWAARGFHGTGSKDSTKQP